MSDTEAFARVLQEIGDIRRRMGVLQELLRVMNADIIANAADAATHNRKNQLGQEMAQLDTAYHQLRSSAGLPS